jgi:hypothetical protein
LFFLIWENIGKTFAHKISDRASTKNVFMVNCHASIKGLFAGMIVFSATVVSIILYAVFRNKIGEDTHGLQNPSHASVHDPHGDLAIYLLKNVSSTGYGPFTSISETPRKVVISIAIIEIVNLSLLLISLSATTWALMKIRKLQYRRTTTRRRSADTTSSVVRSCAFRIR